MGTLRMPYHTEGLAKEFKKRMSKPWLVRVYEEDGDYSHRDTLLTYLIFSDNFLDDLCSEVSKKRKDFDCRALVKRHMKNVIKEGEELGEICATAKGWNLVREAVGLKKLGSAKQKQLEFLPMKKSKANAEDVKLKKKIAAEAASVRKNYKKRSLENICKEIHEIIKIESGSSPKVEDLTSLISHGHVAEKYIFYRRYEAEYQTTQHVLEVLTQKPLDLKAMRTVFAEIPEVIEIDYNTDSKKWTGFLIDLKPKFKKSDSKFTLRSARDKKPVKNQIDALYKIIDRNPLLGRATRDAAYREAAETILRIELGID